MIDQNSVDPEYGLDLCETDDSQEKSRREQHKSTLIDHLVAQFSQVRQQQTKRTIAHLVELAETFDPTIPHMQLLFQDTLMDLLESGEELDTDLKTFLEKTLEITQDVKEAQVIEGEVIPKNDGSVG